MQPASFDRTIPKGLSASAAAGSSSAAAASSAFALASSAKQKIVTSHQHNSDSDSGTDSDEDVLKMPLAEIHGHQQRSRRSSSIVVTGAGQFASPQAGTTPSNATLARQQAHQAHHQKISESAAVRSLADKFFDPKLVRIRAESQRKKVQKAVDSAQAASEDAIALGTSASTTADISYKLSEGQSHCSVRFAPTACCIDENPSDILRPQVPPAVEHGTMVSFEAENLIVLFGGICVNQNAANARASVETKKKRGGGDDDDDDDYDSNSDDFSSVGSSDEDDSNSIVDELSEMPECGVASNTTWIYDTKNLIWSCVSERDLRLEGSSNNNNNNNSENINDPNSNSNSLRSGGENVDVDHQEQQEEIEVAPAPRCGHTAVAMFEDPLPHATKLPFSTKHHNAKVEYAREPLMIIFGGCDLKKQLAYSDVWAFSIRTRRWKCLFSANSIPRGNLTFSLDLLPTDPNDFQVKEKESFFPDDAAFFEGEDVKARLLALTGEVTGPKLLAAATAKRPIRKAKPPCHRWKSVVGCLDELMFVFGGESATFEVLDDLHTFNVLTKQWEVQRTRMSPWPSARFMHGACTVGTKMIISGGTGKRADVLMEDDTWILEMRTLMWRQVGGTSDVLEGAKSVEDALNRCPFLTRPRHVPEVPALISAMEKRLELKAGIHSPLRRKAGGGSDNKKKDDATSTRRKSSATRRSLEVARCEVEGPILLPFDDRIVFYGGREVPTGRFLPNTYVLDLISERWYQADDVLMDQSNLMLHGDINQLNPLRITEKTDAMLPTKRWAHCGCSIIQYSPTQHMSLARSLNEIAYECGGSNICGTVRFTDQRAVDKYIENLQKEVEQQADFSGLLFTRGQKPVMVKTLRAFFFGGGATCSGSGASSRRTELSDCWQMNLKII